MPLPRPGRLYQELSVIAEEAADDILLSLPEAEGDHQPPSVGRGDHLPPAAGGGDHLPPLGQLSPLVKGDGSLEVTVGGLRPDTNYVVVTRAYNAVGSGPPSPPLNVRTSEDSEY